MKLAKVRTWNMSDLSNLTVNSPLHLFRKTHAVPNADTVAMIVRQSIVGVAFSQKYPIVILNTLSWSDEGGLKRANGPRVAAAIGTIRRNIPARAAYWHQALQ